MVAALRWRAMIGEALSTYARERRMLMETPRRFFVATAVAAATALIGLTSAPAASAAAPGAGVTFTSQPATAELVAHYTVSPTAGPKVAPSSAAGDNRQLPRLSKHGQAVRRSASDLAAAPASDNTATDAPGDASANAASPASQPAPANRASASFIGEQSSATTCSYFLVGCNPPDMAVAASPRFVLQGVNTQYEVLDTAGHVQPGWPVSAQQFFGVPNVTHPDGTPCDVDHLSQPFISDPRALYDPVSRRFWAAALQAENALGIAPDCPFKSVYYIAVSRTSDPRGDWNVYEFNMSLDGEFAADFTQIGVNREGVFFSANMFGPATGPNGGFYAEVFEANKARMERGQGGFTAAGFFNLQAHGPASTTAGAFIADTVQPALNVDGSGGSAGVFLDTIDGPDPVTGNSCGLFGGGAADACSGLILWRMSNPIGHDLGGPAPTLTGTFVASRPFVFPDPADQPSCSACIDASDLRISATPVVRDGVLYGGWETALSNGTQIVPAVEWAQVDLRRPSRSQTGYYSLSGDAAATFPALMPDSHGNVVMLFDRMSSAVFPETRFIVKRGNANFHGVGTLLKAGETSYRPQLCGTGTPPTVCRWGDFSAISFDGQNSIWFAGQYANALNLGPPQNGRNWGTWIGAVRAS